MLFAEFGTGEVFLSMLYFFLFFIWIWMLIAIFADLFRSNDLSGWAKAAWCVLIIVLPFLGVFSYLIARGGKMGEHAVEDARRQNAMFQTAVRDAVGSSGSDVDQLAALASLREKGVIDEDEFARMKAKLIAA